LRERSKRFNLCETGRVMTRPQRAITESVVEAVAATGEEPNEFVRGAAHDLGAPLRMVMAFCELLSKDYAEHFDARGREYLSLAVLATTQMRHLLDDLIEFGRPGLPADQRSWFESGETFDGALEILHDAVGMSGAKITRGPLPRIYGDQAQFARLMQNLIGNALKYVAAGVAPRIHVSAVLDRAFWLFSVADNGIGVEADDHARIFEPFKQLHPKTSHSGSGLGLAICRRLVEGFGGRIWVRSTPGKGSTFSFTIAIRDEGSGDV
jgi:signal transduction histidine kinase